MLGVVRAGGEWGNLTRYSLWRRLFVQNLQADVSVDVGQVPLNNLTLIVWKRLMACRSS